MDKNFLFVAACAASLCLGAETVRMPLEWNPTYDTSVPYEVEISPAKLQKLAGADPSAGFGGPVCEGGDRPHRAGRVRMLPIPKLGS